MSSTTEAPVVYRSSARQPGALALLLEAIREIASRRRLVRYLVQAEIKKRGVNTLIGNLWWILDPLLLMLVYIVLVSILARGASIPDYPLFIFAAILPWKWFTVAIIDSSSSVVTQQRLVKQIAFPKVILPVAATVAGVVGFTFGLIPLAALLALHPERISAFPILIPVIAAVQFVFTLAIGMLVAAGNVFVRDLGNVLGHVLRLWFYLSPGLYSLALLREGEIAERFPFIATLAQLNPFAILLESYRMVVYGSTTGSPSLPDFGALGVLLVISLAMLAVTTVVFKRLEPAFAKVL